MRLKAAILMLSMAWSFGALSSRSMLTAQGKSQWDGVYTDAQAKSGAEVYTKSCQECHGTDLEGKGEAPSLVGGEFASAWNELTLNDLFERMSKTMPQAAPGSLSRAQYVDVLAFVLSKNGAPAGQTALSDDAAALKAIMYKMTK